ncbi:hypothetical protein [Nocardia arthritidis]|uniref:DUF2398 family protein n=1 Tax=Nocardia arthritidis TaxID=228602 RepID=A0A6G9YER7_9NOCA|nr:hypothetical protein [Nocardia arthritidis]QIS11493.1 hypothetical protein F5544_18095 [Nocardia arthritidis]
MNSADISDAARLLRYAFGPKERPAPGSQYRILLDRYRTDVGFAEIVGRIADGLALDIHTATQLGLLISGRAEGPFAVNLDSCGLPIRSGDGRLQDRRCFGLVLVALAAYAYPNGEALADTVNPTVRRGELERFLDRRIAALVERPPGSDEMEQQLGAAAGIWMDLPEVLPGQRGGVLRNCRRWYVNHLLAFLVEQGRARREPTLDDEHGEAYVLNDRFRIGLAEMSGALMPEAWQELGEAEEP